MFPPDAGDIKACDSEHVENVLNAYVEPCLQAAFPRFVSGPQTFCRAKDSSGKRAAKLARSQSQLAAWATHRRDKEQLLDLARVSGQRNHFRDMSRKLRQHQLMLGVPMKWIPNDTRCNH